MGCHAVGLRAWSLRSSVAVMLIAACACMALGQDSPNIVRIEEDWELVVGQPDAASDAPQVTCVISPFGTLSSWYATFELNHQSLPSYVPGGLQLQVWQNEVPISQRKFPNASLLGTLGEAATWTQSMELRDGLLTFEIIRGSSTTWGDFGGQGYLKASIEAPCSNLNAYNPEVSVRHSGASFAANRVQSLVLRKVRVFFSDGQQVEDPNPRTVYTAPQ